MPYSDYSSVCFILNTVWSLYLRTHFKNYTKNNKTTTIIQTQYGNEHIQAGRYTF